MATFVWEHPAGDITFEEWHDAVSSPPKIAWIHPLEGPVENVKRDFHYPGADGRHRMRLGRDSQLIHIDIVIVASGVAGIEQEQFKLRQATDDRSGILLLRAGVIEHAACVLEASNLDPIAVPWGGLWFLYGRLTFRQLAPSGPAALGAGGAMTGGKWAGEPTA